METYHHCYGNTVAHRSRGWLPLYTDDQDGCQRTAGHEKLVNQAEMKNNLRVICGCSVIKTRQYKTRPLTANSLHVPWPLFYVPVDSPQIHSYC